MHANAKAFTNAAVAGLIGIASLALAGTVALWVAGSLGISAAAASQIVAAIEIGGWAIVAIGAVFGAGIVGAILGTVRYLLVRQARNLVIA